MPRKSPYTIKLTRKERAKLMERSRQYTSIYRQVIRAKIVLLASKGLSNDAIAARLDTPRQVVSKWRQPFCIQRLSGLEEQPRGGASPLGPSNDRWSLDGRATYLPEASEPSPSGCQGQHRIGRGFGLAPFASSPRPSILHRHFGGRSQGSC